MSMPQGRVTETPTWLRPGKIIRTNGPVSMWASIARQAVFVPNTAPLLVCSCNIALPATWDLCATWDMVVIDPAGNVYEDTAVMTYLTTHYTSISAVAKGM